MAQAFESLRVVFPPQYSTATTVVIASRNAHALTDQPRTVTTCGRKADLMGYGSSDSFCRMLDFRVEQTGDLFTGRLRLNASDPQKQY